MLVQVKADGVSVDLALYRAGAADGVGPNDAAVRWICVRLSGIGLVGAGLSGNERRSRPLDLRASPPKGRVPAAAAGGLARRRALADRA